MLRAATSLLVAALAALVLAGPAGALGGAVEATSACRIGGTMTLKLTPVVGGIAVDFRVTHVRRGSLWEYTIGRERRVVRFSQGVRARGTPLGNTGGFSRHHVLLDIPHPPPPSAPPRLGTPIPVDHISVRADATYGAHCGVAAALVGR